MHTNDRSLYIPIFLVGWPSRPSCELGGHLAPQDWIIYLLEFPYSNSGQRIRIYAKRSQPFC
ncbi:hypothetical protein PQG02_03860 [Nostoc sp. UHCC 0926]|uniref:hypothetical protein n=1 Tax=Nostoc sp. TaxID=1180 RepID=UPI0027A2C2CE|nr:hypothetical protein PQG02_03860 [Nostoc sp. UHCC 0926]